VHLVGILKSLNILLLLQSALFSQRKRPSFTPLPNKYEMNSGNETEARKNDTF